MVSAVLASLLQSYLGKYLELSETSISVGSEVRLKNVRLRESAFTDLGLPIKCVHGKVSRLVIKIPWFNLFNKSTTIDIEGVHLLIVPSTSVRFDESKERKLEQEAKQKRLQMAEDAKRIGQEAKNDEADVGVSGDTFVERLLANIIKNLEVNIRKVHIRYEDGQTNSSGYPFATGVTLQSVSMVTTSGPPEEGKIRLKVFEKQVILDSLAVYWKPKANLFSNETSEKDDEVIDLMFDSSIGTCDNPNQKLMYLLGPISSDATMKWCPNPETQEYKISQVDLFIQMQELGLSLSKYQYHDFVQLLQAIEFMTRASKFRKYKARHNLENLHNYQGRLRDLWKFAFDCVYEEEVMRKLNNWSWTHMKEHINTCKKYREAYKVKLSSKKVSDSLKEELNRYENELDEVNIRIQRQLAERDVKKKQEDEKKSTSSNGGGGFLGWFWGGGGKKSPEESPDGGTLTVKKLEEAMTADEKKLLYEAIDYQENAHHGIYPKSYVAHKLSFRLNRLSVSIRDEDMKESEIMKLSLETVTSTMTQRPSADNAKLSMSMNSLTITGWPVAGAKQGPIIVSTRSSMLGDKLLNFEFENHPPSNPDGNLDEDIGCLYDQRIKLFSSPLEIIYDHRTVRRLMNLFKTPEELNLTALQQTAFSKLKQYRESTALTLQYVIDTHHLVDVDIRLMSSYLVLPHGGTFTETCACTVANLGSISVKSNPISAETRSLKDMSLSDLTETFKKSLRDQVYDKFQVSLENMQVLVALPNENWRSEIGRKTSPLFLLKPTSIKVLFQYCLITNDPELPLCKVTGKLDKISINIADYRLIRLVQILDSLMDNPPEEERTLQRSESEESMVSAQSSFANTGSFISSNFQPASSIIIAPAPSSSLSGGLNSSNIQMTQFKLDFKVEKIDFCLAQLKKHSNEDEEIFHFLVSSIAVDAKLRSHDLQGNFTMGGICCTHLLATSPDGSPVTILDTSFNTSNNDTGNLLTVVYTDVKKNSPDLETVHNSVLKQIDVKFTRVKVTVHQDAIMDLIDKVNKLVDEIASKSKNLSQMAAPPVTDLSKTDVQEGNKTPKKVANPRVAALKTNARTSGRVSPGPWFATKGKARKNGDLVEVCINASLECAVFKFMTTKIPELATMLVHRLKSTFVQTASRKEVTATLEQFDILDDAGFSAGSLYKKLAENVDAEKEVFDSRIILYDNIDPEAKSQDPEVVDIFVAVKLGRIRFVFLMKFLNDLLSFIDPFSGAKEIVAEKTNTAIEGATKSVIDAYVSSTRVQLDIRLEAPLIIVPVHSRSRTTFIADLGTLTLTNSFSMESGRVFDEMHLTLRELKLTRAKIDTEGNTINIIAQCPVVNPITFELHIKRNMSGSLKKEDPAEINVSGTLHKIDADVSKGDYSVLMAIITENFGEKGAFEKALASRQNSDGQPVDRAALTLPVKSKYTGSRTSLASTSSLLEAMRVPERDAEAKAVEFNFKFLGLQMEIYTGETLLDKIDDKRDSNLSLAKIGAQSLSVNGCLKVNSAIHAKAILENLVLEDCRARDPGSSNPNRIVRLMEAKKCQKQDRTQMIEVDYNKDEAGDQNVEVLIHSFILVGSVSYLLEIANFFVLDQKMAYEWKSDEPDVNETPGKMSIFVKIDEPDIFLVENLDDINSDALMMNTELQLKIWLTGNTFSIMAALENIRCHTCRFNPALREETMAQILRPCTLAFTVSQPDGHGMRINVNVGDFCLNVSPRSIQIIQNSVQAFIESMGAEETTETSATESIEDHSDLWLTKPFKENQFWFLKTDDPVEAVETTPDGPGQTTLGSTMAGDEQAIININNLVVKVESGSGNNTIPLLLLESRFNCEIRDWSGPRMGVIGSMNLEMAYYNAKLALWEPVIEPIIQIQPDGAPIKKRWDLTMMLQNNAASDLGSALVSPSMDDTDGFVIPENMPPLMSISLQSRDVLEITVTKSLLGVLNTLKDSFTEVSDQSNRDKKPSPNAPFIVRNSLGKAVTVLLDNRSFKYYVQGQKPESSTEYKLEHDSEVNLVLFRDRSHRDDNDYVSPLQEQTEQAEATLRIRVAGEKGIFDIPVSKADKRFFPFQFRGDEMGDHHGMVSEIHVDNGSKFITFRSIVQIKNHFSSTVNIFGFDGVSKFKKLSPVEPDQVFNVPLSDLYSPPYEFYFQVDGPGENMGLECYPWKKLQKDPQSAYSQQIQCTNTKGRPDIYINVDGRKEKIFLERSGTLSSESFVLDIRPLFVLKNCLPVTLHYTVGQSTGYIEPGQSGYLHGIRFGYTTLGLKIFEFRSTDWSSEQIMQSEMPELGTWRFVSVSDEAGNAIKMDLGVNSTTSRGTLVISIYAPFWMVNKTGRNLTYKGQDAHNMVYHPQEFNSVPMMFSYSGKSFLQKRKASIRIDESGWSDPFTLDTIEDAGKVSCKRVSSTGTSKKDPYHVGVNINMSKSSLTKIITFTPFYMIQNCLQEQVKVWELESDPDEDAIVVEPGQTAPFWPSYGADKIVAQVGNCTTAPFTMKTAHSTLLMLGNKLGGVNVECRTSVSETMASLCPYKRGLAPVQLVNNSKSFMIEYSEKDNNGKHFLAPGESVYFTWLMPQGSRSIAWSVAGHPEEYVNPLLSDDQGVIKFETSHRYLSWVSFLDGMQRVLLFTEDPNLCISLAHSTGENERIEMEIDISIFGIGLSLVNNSCYINNGANYEIIYMSISSSDIVWEIRRPGKTRYKPLTQSQCQAIEEDFQIYLREKSIGKRTKEDRMIEVYSTRQTIKVNYVESIMTEPNEGRLRRQFQKGLWLQVRSSAHQKQIHAKINRVQIDNQMNNCLFPVILAPVPPPKSVVANSIPKPFMELSILQYKSPEHNNLRQYKYISALVQELHIKIDQGLLNAIIELMEEEEILDEDINEFLKEDQALARRDLGDVATLRRSEGQKDFFDFLHLSPLKVHVSFSLTSYKSGGTSRRSNFLGLFLQSLGVTITDTDDIVFRLAYFERKHTFYSIQDLFSDMIRHYSGQAIKQAYVVIFGLDVIGNPFGLVVGVSRSVEDLFYEPFQGAVEGPSEFAEGLVIGVRSVFSGVVGGAAGTVSRITGALGKGLASLTFDEKFQAKRREAIKKRGRQNFGESLARGGKGLVMGIVDGVTGVATKPIEGAREEGFGGFFKGVGKGVVGLVARPTGGIIDFASGTFDSVKRVTEVTEEVSRVRPPRFLNQDGVVRYYNLKEATGNKLLTQLEKGRYAMSDLYVAHEDIQADKESVFMVTNQRVLFLVYQSVLGNWSIDWEFTFAEITGPPPCGKDDNSEKWYIIIKPREEKRKVFGLFGGGDSGKRVFVPNREAARHLARVIEDLRTSQQK